MNDIIRKTIEAKDPSTFLYLLHEEGIFDEVLFREYMKNVNLVTIENTDKGIIKMIIQRNEYILLNALYHFLPDDVYVMKNLPHNMSEYVGVIADENLRLIHML